MKPDFEKMNGLVPAVVQDVKTKQVLMLAYVNEEITFYSPYCIYSPGKLCFDTSR